jgi:hypothetical protein
LNHEIHEYTKTVGRTAILCHPSFVVCPSSC